MKLIFNKVHENSNFAFLAQFLHIYSGRPIQCGHEEVHSMVLNPRRKAQKPKKYARQFLERAKKNASSGARTYVHFRRKTDDLTTELQSDDNRIYSTTSYKHFYLERFSCRLYYKQLVVLGFGLFSCQSPWSKFPPKSFFDSIL